MMRVIHPAEVVRRYQADPDFRLDNYVVNSAVPEEGDWPLDHPAYVDVERKERLFEFCSRAHFEAERDGVVLELIRARIGERHVQMAHSDPMTVEAMRERDQERRSRARRALFQELQRQHHLENARRYLGEGVLDQLADVIEEALR